MQSLPTFRSLGRPGSISPTESAFYQLLYRFCPYSLITHPFRRKSVIKFELPSVQIPLSRLNLKNCFASTLVRDVHIIYPSWIGHFPRSYVLLNISATYWRGPLFTEITCSDVIRLSLLCTYSPLNNMHMSAP